jgi:hypothetical protein
VVDEYRIIPCVEKEPVSMEKSWRTLILIFPFQGKDDDNVNHFENMSIGATKASRFVAWFTLITDIATRLTYSGFGRGGLFFKCHHVQADNYREEEDLKTFNPNLEAPAGQYEEIKRPDFSSFERLNSSNPKLPRDMEELTKKLFSLPHEEQDKYANACRSYQYALEVWSPYPTVSLVALVSAVESMMVDRFVSSYCEDAGKNCPLKRNVAKKFRIFFEQTLAKPLPSDLEQFLARAYSTRSSFVHRALLGKFGAIPYYHNSGKTRELRSEQFQLSRIVRVGLLQWLVEA